MKTIINLTLIAMTVTFVLTSCQMQKVVYKSGNHTERITAKHNGHNGKNKNCSRCIALQEENSVQVDQTKIVKVQQKIIDPVLFAYNTTSSDESTYIVSSVENSIKVPTHSTIALDKKKNFIAPSTKMSPETKTILSDKKSLKSKLMELKKNSSSEGGNGALKAIGWVILILGLLILLFASIIIGGLLMLLGLVFVISGSNAGKDDTEDKSEYVDIVYLKNGSIIRGIVIEQIPNVSIKIQTKDGSIFVYKMEEVEKITKELSK